VAHLPLGRRSGLDTSRSATNQTCKGCKRVPTRVNKNCLFNASSLTQKWLDTYSTNHALNEDRSLRKRTPNTYTRILDGQSARKTAGERDTRKSVENKETYMTSNESTLNADSDIQSAKRVKVTVLMRQQNWPNICIAKAASRSSQAYLRLPRRQSERQQP